MQRISRALMRIVSTAVCCLSSSVAQCQVPNTLAPDPISPEVASIARYGNVPVGLYTGQPNVSFTLYEIDNGYVKVPITLAYNYNGFKLEDYPGWAGLGWTISGAGVITRQRRGLPDESPNGYNGEHQYGTKVVNFLALGLTSDEVQADRIKYDDQFDLLMSFARGQADPEPDMFFFSCPGHSGKFFFDDTQCGTPTKIATLIPHQNLSIKGYFNYSHNTNGIIGDITKFDITDERGVIYSFAKKDMSTKARLDNTDNNNTHQDFLNTWLLTSIVDPFGKSINYTYGPPRLIDLPAIAVDRMVVPDQLTSTPVFYPSSTWESVLDKIDYRNSTNDILGEIIFNEYPQTRLDWDSTTWPEYVEGDQEQPKALQSISVKANGNTIRAIRFKHSYFGDHARLRLDSFQESNGAISIPETKFTYQSGVFPKIGDRNAIFSQDHWGYYTGGVNNTLLPPVTLNFGGILYQTQDDEWHSTYTGIVEIPGNNRAPKPDAASAGLLKQITYPAGGTTAFEWEPNDYYLAGNDFGIPTATCSSVDKNAATLSAKFEYLPPASPKAIEDRKQFTVATEVCATISFRVTAGNCIDNTAYVRMIDTRDHSEIFNHHQMYTNTGTVNTHNGYDSEDVFKLSAGTYEVQVGIECVTCSDPMNFKTVEARISVYLSDDVKSGTTQAPVNALAGGMRMKRITDCALGGVSGCSSKYFRYNDPDNPERSSGNLVSAPIYEYSAIVYQRGSPGEPNAFVGAQGKVYTGGSLVPVTVTMGNSVGYTYVTVLEAEDGSKGRSVHHFTSPQSYDDTGPTLYPYPPRNDNEFKRGILLQQQDYAASVIEPIRSSQVEPRFVTQEYFARGIKVGAKFVDPVGLPGTMDVLVNPQNLNGYYFTPYNIYSASKQILWQEEIIKDQLTRETTSVRSTFVYGAQKHMLPIEKSFTNSDSTVVKTTFRYRDDAGTIAELTARQKSGIAQYPDESAVVEQQSFNDGVLQQTTLNVYDALHLTETFTSFENGPLVEQVAFTEYNSDGNPVSIRMRSGEVHSYQYGYKKRYPVLHAINTSPEDVYADNFEETGTISASAHTGEKVKTSGDYTFAGFTPTNSANTRMSYWYWNADQWKFSGELPYTPTFTPRGWPMDDVRAYPNGAIVQTFTYSPGIGMTSSTDHNGMVRHFKFDDLGRLECVKDDKKNIINFYDYYYKNAE